MSALEEAPVLDLVSRWYLDVYIMLESDRPPAYMSQTSIPLTAIINYGNTFGAVDDLQTFCEIVVGIDRKYLRWVSRNKK